MAQKKTLHSKHTKHKNTETETDSENEAIELDGPKAKKTVDLEAALEPAAIVDEKVIDEDLPVVAEDTEDTIAEELTLDDDELNPFGDKWEQ